MALTQRILHGKDTLMGRLLTYKLIRQLCIVGLVVAVLLLTVWWHFSSAVSHITSVPVPATKPSIATEVTPAPTAPTLPETQVQVSGQQTSPATVKTQLEVNGQSVPVPTNGTTQETIQSPDGNTSVHLSIDATSSGSEKNSSSTRIQMNSSSHSQVVTHETH